MLRALLLVVLALVATDCLADRPNILFIVADDLGWRDVGWHDGPFKTPTLDGLVKTGVELDRHYVQPVCSPTRTALLSGRWTGRFGPHALSPTNRRVFPLGTVTLASALKEAGYSTHMAGKWHLGSRSEWGPQNYGFDQSYGSLNGAVDPWTHKYRNGPYLDTWHRNGQIFNEEGNATELVASQVEKWIRGAKGPWFIYVPFHAVHIPIDTPDEYKQPYADASFDPDPAKNESLRRFGAFISQLDAKVGQFVKAIDETSQRDNTLIVFTSDNGGLEKGGNAYVGKVPPTPALSSNLPLRGFKNQLYEGGVRVPAFVNWPAKLKPMKLDAPMHVADWMPTLTHLVGWKKPETQQFDGQNNWPLIAGEQKRPASRSIYIPHPAGSILLRDGWKLIVRRANPKIELFNVTRDPSEKSELSAQEPARLAELQKELTDIAAGDLKQIPADLEGIPN
jgi:arylsulfatase A-like enzyme